MSDLLFSSVEQMARRKKGVTPQEPDCPRGKCERCYDTGHLTDRTGVAIPGPKSKKSTRRYQVCDTCGADLVRQWRYIVLRILPGGVT